MQGSQQAQKPERSEAELTPPRTLSTLSISLPTAFLLCSLSASSLSLASGSASAPRSSDGERGPELVPPLGCR